MNEHFCEHSWLFFVVVDRLFGYIILFQKPCFIYVYVLYKYYQTNPVNSVSSFTPC